MNCPPFKTHTVFMCEFVHTVLLINTLAACCLLWQHTCRANIKAYAYKINLNNVISGSQSKTNAVGSLQVNVENPNQLCIC